MLFLLSRDQDLTVDQLSEMVSHPRQTCWVFRKKFSKSWPPKPPSSGRRTAGAI
jgi:hypothetical protein